MMERKAGMSRLSWRGREALGEEDMSQHSQVLEEWVEKRKEEKRRQKLEASVFAVLSLLQACEMDGFLQEKLWI